MPMNKSNSSLARNQSMMHLAADPGSVRAYNNDVSTDIQRFEKWPVWLRLIIIVGLSAGLWAGIILLISALI